MAVETLQQSKRLWKVKTLVEERTVRPTDSESQSDCSVNAASCLSLTEEYSGKGCSTDEKRS